MSTFSAQIEVVALAHDILAVARTRAEGTWAAYIAPVPGWNHDNEYQAVLDHGTKLDANVAEAIFRRTRFITLPYAS